MAKKYPSYGQYLFILFLIFIISSPKCLAQDFKVEVINRVKGMAYTLTFDHTQVDISSLIKTLQLHSDFDEYADGLKLYNVFGDELHPFTKLKYGQKVYFFHITPMIFSFTKDEKKFFYLLGTMHKARFKFLPKNARSFLKSQKMLYLESNYRDNSVTSKNDLKEMEALRDDTDPDWYNLLSKDEQHSISTHLNRYFTQEFETVDFHPKDLKVWAAYLFYSFSQYGKGLDSELEKIYMKKGKEVRGLELFKNIDLESIKKVELEAFVNYYKKVVAYKGKYRIFSVGDEDTQKYYTGQYLTDGDEIAEIERDSSLTTRNKSWIPTIAKAYKESKKGDVLFAVGYTHLVGKNGILSLLRQNGFMIKKMKFN